MFLGMSQAMQAQGTDPLAAIQQKLEQHIVLAKLDNNGEIIAAGSVLTLKLDSLQMCSTSAPANAGAPANTYKSGKLSAGMFSWRFGLGLVNIDPNTIPMRKYVPGEKFWVVNYNVKKNGVEFKLWTDADSNNVRYWSWLEFPFAKNQIPSADEVMNTIGEVLAVDTSAQPSPVSDAAQSGDNTASFQGRYFYKGNNNDFIELDPGGAYFGQQHGKDFKGTYTIVGYNLTYINERTGRKFKSHIIGDTLNDPDGMVWEKHSESEPASEPTPPPAPVMAPITPPPPEPAMAPIAPPPPPPAAPKTIALGQTKDEVAAILGQPDKVANLGTKEIDYYPDMKITFVKGKVTDIQ